MFQLSKTVFAILILFMTVNQAHAGLITGYLCLGAAGAAGGVGVVAAAPFILGFGATGIAAGSIASWMMSGSAIASGGGVVAGGAVAILQSLGATGLTAGAAAVGAGAGAAATTTTGAILSIII